MSCCLRVSLNSKLFRNQNSFKYVGAYEVVTLTVVSKWSETSIGICYVDFVKRVVSILLRATSTVWIPFVGDYTPKGAQIPCERYLYVLCDRGENMFIL